MIDVRAEDLLEPTNEGTPLTIERVCLVDSNEQMVCLTPMFADNNEPDVSEEEVSSSNSLWT